MKLSASPKPNAIHAILYGPPKIGKSALAGEMAEHGYQLIWLDCENGSSVLYTMVAPQFHENIELIRVPDTPLWPIAIETVMKVAKATYDPRALLKICDTHGKIGCPVCVKDAQAIITTIDFSKLDKAKTIFVVDSLTQLSKSSMNQIIKEVAKTDEDKVNFKPGWDEYGKQGQHLDFVLSHIQNSPFHWIVISHEMEIEQSDEKLKLQPVGGTRNYSRTVPKFFDEVIYMRMFNKRHSAVSETTAIANVLAGSRNQAELSKIDTSKDKLSLVEVFEGDRVKTQREQAMQIIQGDKK